MMTVPQAVVRSDRRLYLSMLLASTVAGLLHFSWIFLFAAMGLPWLSLANIASVACWLCCLWLLRAKGAIVPATVIGAIEVTVHQFLAVYYLGWGHGFQYFLLVVVAFAFLLRSRLMIIPSTFFVTCVAAFLWYYHDVQRWLPHDHHDPWIRETFFTLNVVSAFGILAVISFVYSEAARTAEDGLEVERRKSDRLLLNVLPAAIAERLKSGEVVIADHFESTTILFSDIVGFTAMSAKISAAEMVERLNQIFSAFDALASRHGLEKIKTIGDAYMVAGGIPVRNDGQAAAVAAMAVDMLAAVDALNHDTALPIGIRIGIHTGPAVAGVIGTHKFFYDIWGDTVNIASRMESSGLPGRIQISEMTRSHVAGGFVVEERGPVDIKGKGRMTTYWLVGRRT